MKSDLKSENIKRVLIIKLRYIGDVLLSVPAIRAVKETFPQADITYLANPGTTELLQGNPLVQDVLHYPKKKSWELIKELRRRNFDLAIHLAIHDRGALAAFFSGARYRIGPDPQGDGFWGKKYLYTHLAPPHDNSKHQVEQYLDILRPFGITTRDLSISIYLEEKDYQYVQQLFQREGIRDNEFLIHCHPVARYPGKIWNPERMAACIDYLQSQPGCRVIVTCSISDNDIQQIRQIRQYLKTKPVFVLGDACLREIAALSSKCQLYFGLDSGIMHIAASLGTPVVALFGYSPVQIWRPWGEGHVVIQQHPDSSDWKQHPEQRYSMETISTEQVLDVLKKKIADLQQTSVNAKR